MPKRYASSSEESDERDTKRRRKSSPFSSSSEVLLLVIPTLFRVICLKEQQVTSGHPLQQATTPTDRISKVKRMRAATKAAMLMETLASFRTTTKSVSFCLPLGLFRQDVLMTLSPSDRSSTICARSISSRPKDLSDPRSWASLRQHMSSKLTKLWKKLPMSKALWPEFLRTL